MSVMRKVNVVVRFCDYSHTPATIFYTPKRSLSKCFPMTGSDVIHADSIYIINFEYSRQELLAFELLPPSSSDYFSFG